MRRRFGGTQRAELFGGGDQLDRGRRLGEAEVADLTATEGDEALGAGLIRPVTLRLSRVEIELNPLPLELGEVLNGVDSTDPKLHVELQRIHCMLRCGGAHTASPFSTSGKVGRILYTRITAHSVLLAEECFFEALLSTIVIKKKTRPFRSGLPYFNCCLVAFL